MIKRSFSFFLLVLMFATSQVQAADDSGPTTMDAAKQALQSGDIDAALEGYLGVLDASPDNVEAMQAVAMIALEMGITDLAGQMLVSQQEVAVRESDQALLTETNAEIADIYSMLPGEVTAAVAMAARVEEEQEDILATYQEMSAEAESLVQAGDFESAIGVLDGLLLLSQDMLGPEHWLTAIAARDLGYAYRQLGMAEEADGYYNEAVAIASITLGEDHPETIAIYGLMAELYTAAGMMGEAEGVYDLVIGTLSATLGEGHEKTIDARLTRVAAYEYSGMYDEARATLADICAVIEMNYGAWHPQTLDCLRQKASLASSTANFVEATETYDLIVTRMAESLSTIDADALNVLSQLAEVYRQQGDYDQAKTLLSGVIRTAIQIGALETGYTAKSYLGRVLNNQGELNKAQAVTEEVLEYGLANWGDRPLAIYNTLLELGAIYQSQGKLAEAEATFQEALQGLMELVGETHPSTLVALNNLGQVYEQNGQYDLAEPILKEALDSLEATLGSANPQSSRARNNLALLFESQGNFREAEPLYKQTIEVLSESQGDDYTDTIAVRNNLAFLYMMMEDYDKSAAMFARVLEQWTVIFGEDHQFTMKAMNNLGRVNQRLGKLAEAEQLVAGALERRRAKLGPEHLDVIRSMIDLGSIYIDQDRLPESDEILTSAVTLAEKVLGNQHPYTFEALNNLARSKEAQEQYTAALEIRQTGFERRSEFLDTMLWVTGENAREGYIRLFRPELNDYLNLLTRSGIPDAGKLAIGASLQRKGLLLKLTSEIQQISRMTDDPKMSSIANELQEARKELAALTLSGPTAETKGRHVQALYELEQIVNELQGEIGRASVRYRSSISQISVDTLAAALPEGTALVDFLTYEEGEDKKILAGVVVNEDGEIRYELLTYADRSEIDEAIIEYRTIIQDDQADEDEQLEIGQIAYELVWDPVNEAIGDAEYVYLIPDGTLNILPFNALVDADESYLIQTHDIHTLTSGRDLLPNGYRLAQGDYVILAGPDYNSDDVVSEEELDVARGRRSAALQMDIRGAGGGLRGLQFSPLPGAYKEGEIIQEQVIEKKAPNIFFFGADAQERVLTDLENPPEILHMATHGFFLKPDEKLRKRLLKMQRGAEINFPPPGDNPLLRSGMAFAGINTNAQFLGDIDTVNDGVLTALEVLDLNLSGTKLVVLSACETGLGEIHEGEGVYGLRRSFQEAGVAEVISSLWEVSDAGTQALMTSFYDRVLTGTPARIALRETQLEMMDSPEWGYPYIWSAFMIVGSYESAGITVQ